MGILFQKRIKSAKGAHLNISEGGTGLSRRQREKEAANSNPLRFLVIFISLFLSIILPLWGDASWLWFPLLSIGGIIVGICIPNSSKDKDIDVESDEFSQNNIAEEKDETPIINIKEVDMLKVKDIIKSLNFDPLFEDAARVVVLSQQGSTSMIQRRFAIGYNRAGRMMEQLEKVGVVGCAIGSAPRQVLVSDEKTLMELLSKLDVDILKETIESEPLEEIDHLNNSSRLISLGINLEKERMIDEAISVYEKAIIPKLPVKHPYERLAILYRKRKDYINEIRVLTDAISVFMKENERRAGLVFDKDNSLHDMVMRAIERNESIKYEDGKWAFIQYDVMELITRLEKAKTLLGKSNINEGRK